VSKIDQNERWRTENFVVTAPELAENLRNLSRLNALSTKLLSEDQRLALLSACDDLTYRDATPVVGEGENKVFQDFALCMDFKCESPFRSAANALTLLVQQANAMIAPACLPATFGFNDLIVQRYDENSTGMSPHRDHIRYTHLVALVVLNGKADFSICDDRSGTNSRTIESRPGDVIFMLAPGFADEQIRPLHQVKNIIGPRHSFGLRLDSLA